MVANNQIPLVVIVGPTASGKSEVALRLAKEYNGEIICADSRTVYKGLDIGTAKPSVQDQQQIPHWGLDVVNPDEVFTAADFQKYAKDKILEIRSRGNTPFLVGGTGLYIDAVILDYQFSKPKPRLREKLDTMPLEQLIDYCYKNNINMPENSKNARYIRRAIEQNGVNRKKLTSPIPNIIVVGITTSREALYERIHQRSEHMFEHGVIEEARVISAKYGWESEALTGNVYRLVRQYLAEDIDSDQLKDLFEQSDRRLVKKQLTWLKRHSFVEWMGLEDAYKYLDKRLAEFVQP